MNLSLVCILCITHSFIMSKMQRLWSKTKNQGKLFPLVKLLFEPWMLLKLDAECGRVWALCLCSARVQGVDWTGPAGISLSTDSVPITLCASQLIDLGRKDKPFPSKTSELQLKHKTINVHVCPIAQNQG